MSQEYNVEEQAEAILRCVKNADNDTHALSMIKTNLNALHYSHTEELEQARRKAKLDGYSFAIGHFRERLEVGQSFEDAVRDMQKLADKTTKKNNT